MIRESRPFGNKIFKEKQCEIWLPGVLCNNSFKILKNTFLHYLLNIVCSSDLHMSVNNV